MSDFEREESGFYKPRDPFIGTTKITKEDIVQDFRSPPDALPTTPTQPADEMAAMPSEEMIEAGYRALVACKPMTSTDCEREACEAIYTAMRALEKPVAAMPSEEVERVAQAIYYASTPAGSRWELVDTSYQYTVWRAGATAAMRALAKPSEALRSSRATLDRIALIADEGSAVRLQAEAEIGAIDRALAKPDDGVVRDALDRGLEYAIEAANEINDADSRIFQQIMRDVAKIEAALASLVTGGRAKPDDGVVRNLLGHCEVYADFIRSFVKADDIEMHPYLPALEQDIEEARASLATGDDGPQGTGK